MKSILSLAVLALAASQAMAVVPTPVKNCTKTVIITPADVSCVDFAAQHQITPDQLYEWNLKLSRQCTNLDVGAPICVSISGTATSTSGAVKPTSASVTVPTTSTVTSAHPTSSASSSAAGSSSSSGAATQSSGNTPKPSNSKTTDSAAAGAFGSASSFVAAAGAIAAVAVSLIL